MQKKDVVARLLIYTGQGKCTIKQEMGGSVVIFFSPMRGGLSERLLRIIESVVSEEKVKICRNIDALSRTLRRPRDGAAIAIFLATSGKDLPDILSLRDHMSDIKIILVLPNSDPDTVSKGHVLRPRFMSDCNSDFQEIAAVLKRMIENMDNKTFSKMNRGKIVAL
jgi:hypothetical protein